MQKYAIIKTNNKAKKTIANIGGKDVEVVVPATPGFLVCTYDSNTKERKEEFLSENVKGQVVAIRYKIESPFNAKERYNSAEFKSFKDTIKIYSGNKTIFTGTYQQAKIAYDSGKKNFTGGIVPTFSLKVVFYIDIGGDVVKLLTNFNRKVVELMKNLGTTPITSKEILFSTEVVNVAGSDKNVLKFTVLGDADPFKAEEFDKTLEKKNDNSAGLQPFFDTPIKTHDADDINVNSIPF